MIKLEQERRDLSRNQGLWELFLEKLRSWHSVLADLHEGSNRG